MRDLLGVQSPAVEGFLPDDRVGPFATNSTVPVSELVLEKYREAAEDVSVRASERLDELAPCDGDEDACADAFIERFGARAYRRPLASEEVETLREVYAFGAQTGGYAHGIQMVISTVLQSPNFLYLFEFGEGEPEDGVVRLSSWELAARLSYTLWNTIPDDELLDAAREGLLSDPAELEAQARRMLDDPRAEDALVDFHAQWLGVEAVDELDKDAEHFPEWSPTLAAAMKDEFHRFITQVFAEDGSITSLLTAPYAFPEGDLLALYGMSADALDEDGLAMMPTEERSGVLTLPAVLAMHAHRERTSPVHRGILIREKLLCQPLPPPPPGVTDILPESSEGLTQAELLRKHRENPECASCHDLIDPLGFAFENYDSLGRFRTTDEGSPIDASGELIGTDVDGTISNVPQLAERLVQSEQVQTCVVEQWFRFTFGRPTAAEDKCSKGVAVDALAQSEGDVREMLVALVTADAFRYRRVDPA